jgi:hypothetical protein
MWLNPLAAKIQGPGVGRHPATYALPCEPGLVIARERFRIW